MLSWDDEPTSAPRAPLAGTPEVASAAEVAQKIAQLAAELARLHKHDRRLPPEERDGMSLVVGFRSWEFAAFTALRR